MPRWRLAPGETVRGSITPEGETDGRPGAYYVRRIRKEQRIYANFLGASPSPVGRTDAGRLLRTPRLGHIYLARES
jgi:hypothetical protein